MEIITVNNYENDENTYVIKNNGKCIVIDPGNKIKNILDAIGEDKLDYIFLTHCHYDHILYLNELREMTNALVVSGDNCSNNIGDITINLFGHWLGENKKCNPSDIILNDGDVKSFCDINVKCIYTPGHTNCCVCYLIEDKLFSGDTLFLRSVGRCDLPTGDGATLEKSIKEKLYTMPEETQVYPGHGRSTNIGYEKKFNIYVCE